MKKHWIPGMSIVVMLAVTLGVVSAQGAFAGVREAAETESVQAPAATSVVTSTADSGPGTLRQALLDAGNGDAITFDPAVFPPGSPVTITLASALPHLTQGNLTIDASIAGVILDGSGIGTTPEAVLLDDVSLTMDGSPNLLDNGGFSAGLGHWRPWDGRPGATRGVNSSDFTSSPSSYEWTSVAHAGNTSTVYDTSDTIDPFSDSPFYDGSTVWIPATGGSTVELRFWYRYGGVGATLWALTSSGGQEMDEWGFDWTADWTEAAITQALPADAFGVAFRFGFGHSESETSGLVITSSGNIIRGAQIVDFPNHGIELSSDAQDNVVGGDRGVGTGLMGQGNLMDGNGGDGVHIRGADVMRNIVAGNYIGADVSGTAALGNHGDGVEISEGAQYNIIGGDTEGERNIITLNRGNGIAIQGSDTMSNTVSGNLIGLDQDGTVDLHAQTLSISPGYATDTTIFVGTEEHGIFKSIDGGSRWLSVNTGLNSFNVQALAVSPNYAADQTVFASTAGGGVFKSTDGGGHWVAVNAGLQAMNVRAFAVSPDYQTDQSIFAGTNEGVFRSMNGGSDWSAVNSGLIDPSIEALAISPNYATDQTIFASIWGGGVFKSSDMGLNWVAANNGLTTLQITALAVSPSYAADQTLFAGTGDGRVFKTGDRGGSWVSTNFFTGLTDVGSVRALAITPSYATDKNVFVSSNGGHLLVSKSTDGGSSWTHVRNGLSNSDHIGYLVLSPNYATDQTAFLSASWNGVFKSNDGGGTWVPASNGLTELGNFGAGVFVTDGAQWNIIGGDIPSERNVISNNILGGVGIRGADTDHNIVTGNYIGTDATGYLNLGNSWYGVGIQHGVQGSVIGGTATGERNVISGNWLVGIDINGSGTISNVVIGNFIGTDVTGSAALGNRKAGIGISDWGGCAQQNRIGGTTVEERNIISGNRGDGVAITGGDTINNTVSGNYIGTDATGSLSLGNGGDGVSVGEGAQYNMIGGDSPEERNIVGGNYMNGISIRGGAMVNVVVGNYIGTDASGVAPLPNGANGVSILDGASKNTIGISNTIAFNAGDGVDVHGNDTISNTITRNSIYENARMGISLSNGGNTELPAPTIVAYDLAAGMVSGTACGNCTIEIFSDGDDEGVLYEGRTTTDGAGSFVFSKGAPLTGPNVTATATDARGNTSEFSVVERTVLLPLVLKHHEPPPRFPVFIGDEIAPRPISQQGEVFYVTSVRIPPRLTAGARYYFSSRKDSVAEALVDDKLAILLDSVEVFAFDFSAASGRPESAVVEVPWAVMEQIIGQTVTIEYRDVRAHIVSASPIWLIEVLPTNGNLRR